MPYTLDLTFYKFEFETPNEVIKGYRISKINKRPIKLLYIDWDYQNQVYRQTQNHVVY